MNGLRIRKKGGIAFSVMLGIVMGLVTITGTVRESYATDLSTEKLFEGGFEGETAISGIVESWDEYGGGSNTRTFSQDAAEKVSGNYSQKISITNYSDGTGGIYQSSIKLMAHKAYTFKVYLKDDNDIVNVSIKIFDNNWTTKAGHIVNPTSDFAEYAWTFTPDFGDTSAKIAIYFEENGTLWMDDASLRIDNPFVEAEEFTTAETSGSWSGEPMSKASGQIAYQCGYGTGLNAYIETSIGIDKDATYAIWIRHRKNWCLGKWRLYIDGDPFGDEIDGYASPAGDPEWVYMGNSSLSRGNHTFKIEITTGGTDGNYCHALIDTLLITPNTGLTGEEDEFDLNYWPYSIYGEDKEVDFGLASLDSSLNWAYSDDVGGETQIRDFFAKTSSQHESAASEATKYIIDKATDANFNLVTGYAGMSSDITSISARVEEAIDTGIHYMSSHYPLMASGVEPNLVLYVNANGNNESASASFGGYWGCPFHNTNWDLAYKAIADPLNSLKEIYPTTVVGAFFDLEGSKRDYCYCQYCYEGFLTDEEVPPEDSAWDKTASERYQWLVGNDYLDEYKSWEQNQLYLQAKRIREEVQTNPSGTLLDENFEGVTISDLSTGDSDGQWVIGGSSETPTIGTEGSNHYLAFVASSQWAKYCPTETEIWNGRYTVEFKIWYDSSQGDGFHLYLGDLSVQLATGNDIKMFYGTPGSGDSTEAQISSTAQWTRPSSGAWHSYKVESYDYQLRIYIDDEEVYRATSSKPQRGGGGRYNIYFRIYNQSTAGRLDEVKIYRTGTNYADFAFGLVMWDPRAWVSEGWFGNSILRGFSTSSIPVFIQDAAYNNGYLRAPGYMEWSKRKLVNELGYYPFHLESHGFLRANTPHVMFTPEQSGKDNYLGCRHTRGAIVYHDTYTDYESDFSEDYWTEWNRFNVWTMSIDDMAGQETTVEGTMTGDYSYTHTSDDIYGQITEVATAGDRSSLEHKWVFTVTGGTAVTVHIEAYHSANSEGDDFVFAYSTDDSAYTDMFTVTKTSDDGKYQSYDLPSATNGTIYIRVVDTDNTEGNSDLDSIYIDHMSVASKP